FSFYTLYRRLLADAGRPQRCLDDAARYGLIRTVCASEDLRIFRRIAHTSGFIRIVADLIYELKQNLIMPDLLMAAANSDKERELAHIYNEYQRLLQKHQLVDREGEGWLALEALQDIPTLARDVRLLVTDGYDQFNLLQANLLGALSLQVGESIVTLTTVKGREETIGRRFTRARQRLHEVCTRLGLTVEEIEPEDRFDPRHPALQHLSEHIFVPKAPVYEPPPPTPSPLRGEGETRAASGDEVAIRFVEAPDMPREVGAVLRRVKKLLLAGVYPDDVLIALRDWASYGGYFAAQGRSYGIPLALHYGEPLANNPAVAALMDLLALSGLDFRRRELLDVLRSPYFSIPGLTDECVDLLDRLSMAMMVTGGRKTWLEALEAAKTPSASSADEEDDSPTPFDPDLVELTQRVLSTFFDAVTPPEQGNIETYVSWLEALIGEDNPDPDEEEIEPQFAYTLNIPKCVRVPAAQGIVERDLSALNTFARVLRGMVEAGALFSSLGQSRNLTWQDFIGELQTAVANASIERNMSRDGRVLVTTVTDARGLPHKHLFIVGLSEGVFPAPVPEDPLLLDTERLALAKNGVELSTQSERADDDGLFYELMNQAHETLTLSRPYVKDGVPWPESHLWRAVRALFPDLPIERLRVGQVVPAEEVATPQEVALAVVDGANSLRGWLMGAYPDYWMRIEKGREIELGRISRNPHDQYSGRLRDETLISMAAEFLDPRRVWSATQLNEFGTCGFRFFARRLLKLEALREPEDGMDTLQLGTLNHEILEATYTALAEQGIPVTPECADLALATLREKAMQLLADAPRRLGFRASALWEQEKAALLRRLEALVREDFSGNSPIDKAFASDQPRYAYHFETEFGKSDGFGILLGKEWLRVAGKIDRVDWQGDRAIVIDYKTGSSKIPTSEVERGRNFQMMVYLLAAQRLFEAGEIGGVFWHLGNRETSGVMLSSNDQDQAVIESAKKHLIRYLARGRAGDFAANANKMEDGRCASFCDYHQMCRMAVLGRKREA
ncbi:MAG TPA: PD-(D/E)XK nuclease family protein, partial [Oceanobacillus sp.]|nr:PD-(D/E)XK nuclease family protein [Oceanobacillus sp.]